MDKNIKLQAACKEEYYIFEEQQLGHSGFNLNWIQEFIGTPKTIIEFGSFDGGDGLRYKLAYPNCDIYSIEADPQLYEKIKKFEKYGLKVFNYAICDKNGEIDFNRCRFKWFFDGYNIDDISGSGSILKQSQYNKEVIIHQYYETQPITVPASTIGTFCNNNNIKEIDLMHIDVEGALKEVLNGFDKIRPKVLFMELDGAIKYYEGASEFDIINYKLENMEYELIYRGIVDSLYVKKT